MKSYFLYVPFLTFFSCMMLHILLWRMRRPKHHALALLSVFIAVPALALLLAGIFGDSISGIDLYGIFLLHAALSFAYIQVYPASQADSPSFKILLHVEKSMPRGMSSPEIAAHFPASELLEARIRDLVDSGLVIEREGNLALTSQGKLLIKPFIALRKFMGLPAGAG